VALHGHESLIRGQSKSIRNHFFKSMLNKMGTVGERSSRASFN
jgi:hypothetical protein